MVNGYFNNYSNLSKSNIPNNKKIFYSCQFSNITKKDFGKNSLTRANFHDDCIICDELLSAIEVCTENNTNKHDLLKNDLKKIFKVGFKGGAFIWKSEKIYKQQCASLKLKIPLDKYIEILQQEGFIIKENAKASPDIGYKVHGKYILHVKEFLTQSLVSDSIELLMQNILKR